MVLCGFDGGFPSRWGTTMNVKRLFTDESAVSPVIGVVLMVAITVLLAATAATFFLGIGQDNTNAKPQAAFDFDYTANTNTSVSPEFKNDSLKVSHNSGDTITAKNLEIVVSDAETYEKSSTSYSGLKERFQWNDLDTSIGADSSVSGGTNVRVNAANVDSRLPRTADGLDLDVATVKVVWDDPGSNSKFTMSTWND